MTTFLQITTTIFLTLLSVMAIGQKVEYRNDSLFIDNVYVDAQTPKDTLDKILNETGKIRKFKKAFQKHPLSEKKVKRTTIYYLDLGLSFTQYKYDKTKLSVVIRLHPYSNSKLEANAATGKLYSGQLFIGENYINNKRHLADLQGLENCKVTVKKAFFGVRNDERIIEGNIIYQQNIIKLSFDPSTEQLTSVSIHHNFEQNEQSL